MINVGERIKTIRKSKGFTSNSLAEQLEVSQSFVSGIENGSKKCSLETLDSICTILDITLAEFFQEDDSDINPNVKRLLEASKHLTAEQKELLTSFLETLNK
ncbi:helix-turn-helix domain-containing protein [Propionispora hippei]|uniref:Transcriptional regulator, contains XRE-family HTH domain n=1 Tax=Propionispora hippei DSM 15287 TaxID=1123003 RepID=A0A1M6DZH2_9FIRM|nr:helix-turn-helix transcriptional regulator [Propionispora hippei]SHI78428.1 Transcriptional regulator, contains XRE-family HTH domain [Propionispora hippei DSM 15287]